MSSTTSLIVLALAALVASCTVSVGPGVRGSGNLVTETRPVGSFDEIVLEGSGEVSVEVTGADSLEVEAEDNIIPLLTTEVTDGRLVLGSDGSFSTTRGITYIITAATLNGVTIRGSGNIVADRIDSDAFGVEIDGSGDVTLNGSAVELGVQINGSGNVDGFGLEATTASVEVNGSGTTSVNAVDALDVEINGSGDIVYEGDPVVDRSINGSGDVRRR